MRVKNIKITNYKGILDSEIEFNENLNVFIGSNGAGKTTLLEAIVIGLSKLTERFVGGSGGWTKFDIQQVNYFKHYITIKLTLDLKEFAGTNLHLFRGIGVLSSSILASENVKFKKQIQPVEKALKAKKTLPILKFYSANRGSISYKKFGQTIYEIPQLEAWANFIHGNVSYSKFFKWFSENEILELRMQRDATDFNIQNPHIQYVRAAISRTFQILEGKEYIIKSDQIKRSGTNELIPILSLQEVGTSVKEILDNKSDGEKAIVSLIADIAYNLSIANGSVSSERDVNFLDAPGIVLIDEIEAHLHPNWQRKIIPLLTKIFPHIQFFITTHSPQVVSSVSSESVFVCEDFQFSKINIKSKGLDTNSLLKFIFNSTERPKEYIDLLEEIDALIERNASISKIEAVIEKISLLEKGDSGTDVSQLLSELELRLEAYKFDLEHEINS